jgi:hypothetical protein
MSRRVPRTFAELRTWARSLAATDDARARVVFDAMATEFQEAAAVGSERARSALADCYRLVEIAGIEVATFAAEDVVEAQEASERDYRAARVMLGTDESCACCVGGEHVEEP